MIPAERTLLVRGIRTRLLKDGQGTPVLFLHGAGGMNGWPEFFGLLARRHEVLFPEHPGFGASEGSDSINTVLDLAMYYQEFLHVQGLTAAHVIGSSFGGWLAAELALIAGASIKSLTLIGPAALRPRAAPVAGALPPTEEQFTRKLYFDQAIADRLLAQPADEELRRLQVRNRATAARLGGAFHNPELESKLAAIEVPALIVWGDDDKLVSVANAPLWSAAFPLAETCIVPQCGHLPHLEKPGYLAGRVGSFLAAVDGNG
jgi:pimeloyl-ACP methyl ester carboxylesterase